MSWPLTAAARCLGVEIAIVQAPMVGVATPALVAAVSAAGGLGSLGAALMAPEQLRAAIREIRELTDRPFAVNVFAWADTAGGDDGLRCTLEALEPLHAELGLAAPRGPAGAPDLPALLLEQLQVIADERVAVCSVALGIPPLDALRATGAVLVGSATCVDEARALEAAGFDVVVAQGSEAGGHRSGFGTGAGATVGTLALVPQVVDAVGVPVLAAGGIMDGRGVAAALALGAGGAQLGTAFLACAESGAPAVHKAALPGLADTATALTAAPTGRCARLVRTRLVEVLERPGERAAFPLQAQLTAPLAGAAADRDAFDLSLLFAGQAAGLARALPAGDLVERLRAEVSTTVERLGSSPSSPATAQLDRRSAAA